MVLTFTSHMKSVPFDYIALFRTISATASSVFGATLLPCKLLHWSTQYDPSQMEQFLFGNFFATGVTESVSISISAATRSLELWLLVCRWHSDRSWARCSWLDTEARPVTVASVWSFTDSDSSSNISSRPDLRVTQAVSNYLDCKWDYDHRTAGLDIQVSSVTRTFQLTQEQVHLASNLSLSFIQCIQTERRQILQAVDGLIYFYPLPTSNCSTFLGNRFCNFVKWTYGGNYAQFVKLHSNRTEELKTRGTCNFLGWI